MQKNKTALHVPHKRLHAPLGCVTLAVAGTCCAWAQTQSPSGIRERIVPVSSHASAASSGDQRDADRGDARTGDVPGQERLAQFDPDILRKRGLSPNIGNYFRQGARFPPGAQSVSFVVNGNEIGRRAVVFDAAGRLCFTPVLIVALGLRQPARITPEKGGRRREKACPDYRDHSPRTLIVLRPSEGIVDLTVPLEDTLPTSKPSAVEKGGIGALLNYRAYAYDNRFPGGETRRSRYVNTELGFNAGDWIVRSHQTYSGGEGVNRFQWQSAYAQKTFDDARQVLQAGRITTLTPLYAGLPIHGAQWFPERGLRQLQSFPVTGVAATRARVEIRQSGVLLYSTIVPPGPFSLTDYPLTNVGADLRVSVFEESGGERIITVPASSLLLASDRTQNDGLSLAAGQLWNAADAHGGGNAPVVTGGYGWALRSLGGTLGALLSRNYVSAGVASNWKFSRDASVFAQLIASRDERRDVHGVQGSAALAWRPVEGVALGASGNLRTLGYRTVQEAVGPYQATIAGRGMRSQIGATASWSLDRWGSVSAGVTRTSAFDAPPDHMYSLGWGTSWRRINLQTGISRNAARAYPAHSSPQVAGWPQPRANTYAYVNLSIPLGDSITSTSYARRTNDETRYGTALDQRVNDMLDYRLSVDRVADRPTTETSGSVHALPRYASTSLGITDRQNGGRSYYAEITGSLLATSAGWGFSPYAVQDTFGVVRTGDVVGLKVMTPQGPVWSGPGGSAAVPSLQAYRPSRVEASLDAGAIDIDVGNPLQVVQPGRGAVVRMEMDARRVRRVLLGVVDALGRPLPKGLPVLRRNGALFSSTAQGGRVMVDHMTEGVPLYVELAPGRRCLLQDIRTRPRAADGLFESGSAVCR